MSPFDNELILGASDVRRRFFDGAISQLDAHYLEYLQRYHQVLRQRNAFLKSGPSPDPDLMDVYDRDLVNTGTRIHARRREAIRAFIPLLEEAYRAVAGTADEHVGLTYRTELDGEDFEWALKRSLSRDIALQRTNVGIHRDDFLFDFEDGALRRRGSQGQQKSFLMALKMAQFEMFLAARGFRPIVLMDDLFDRLDDKRIGQLLQRMGNGHFGQIFVTDAHPSRTKTYFREAGLEARHFDVRNGRLQSNE